MSNIEQAIKNVAHLDLHTTFPAKVVAYDEAGHTATLQPLYKVEASDGNTHDYPQLLKVPVIRWRFNHKHYRVDAETGADVETTELEEIKLILQAGDIVACSCSEKSVDSIFAGTVHAPQSKRKYDIKDAIVIGLL
jgi:hypothetical protein